MRMTIIGTSEAAKRLGVDPAYVRMLIGDGRLKASKIGNSWAIDERSIEAFERKRKPRGRPSRSKR